MGLLSGLLAFIIKCSRDAENKSRFPDAIIDPGSSFSVKTQIGKGARILGGSIINNSTIGKYSYVNRNCLVQNAKIGNYCSIAHEVNIGLGRHPLHLASTSPIFYRKNNPLKIAIFDDSEFQDYLPITIGHDVWIGARAIIMDGVTIGNGAIVAANAVVTKNVSPFSIVAGVPAKEIKERFNRGMQETIADSEWWTVEPEDALKYFQTFMK